MAATFTVSDMTCNHCKQSIETALSALAGVEGMTVDVDAKTVTVTGPVADDQVADAIREAGYTPER